MRVLEIFGEPIIYGGQETFVYNFIEGKNDKSIIVDVATPYYCENRKYKNSQSINSLYAYNLRFEPGKSRINILRPLYGHLKQKHYDIIHIHSGSISFLAYASIAGRLCGIKKRIVHSHSMGYSSIKHSIVRLLFIPFINWGATDFCACSYDAGVWKFSRKICEKKLNIIKNGIDIRKYIFDSYTRCELREKLGILYDDFVVGHVGRFSPEKNHFFLIKVFAVLCKQLNYKAKLLLIGEGELKENIERYCKKYQIEKNVILTGAVNDVYRYYNAMDVFCLPSIYEGFSIVNVEALANGLKTILSCGVPREAKISNDVKIMNDFDLKKWVGALIGSKSDRRDEKNNVLREKGYDIEQTIERLKILYRQ